MPRRRKQNSLLLITVAMIPMLILAMATVNPAIAVATEKVQPGKIHPGQENYEEFCAACHGYDGIPVLPGTPNFSTGERLNKKDSELLQAIREGKGDVMPPWENVLNEQAQQDVLDYIKEVINQKSADNDKQKSKPMVEEKP